MVSQDIILFDDTVRANIAYANLNASDEQIKKACDFAAATEFIENLPQAYETIIGENGIKTIWRPKNKEFLLLEPF